MVGPNDRCLMEKRQLKKTNAACWWLEGLSVSLHVPIHHKSADFTYCCAFLIGMHFLSYESEDSFSNLH